MSEIQDLKETHRALGNAPVSDGEGKSVVLRRTFAASVTEAWAACTDKVQLAKWFSGVEGGFEQGGSFQGCCCKVGRRAAKTQFLIP